MSVAEKTEQALAVSTILLHDESVAVTSDNLLKLLSAAGLTADKNHAEVFARYASSNGLQALLSGLVGSVGSSSGSSAAATSAPAETKGADKGNKGKKEEKKVEAKVEEEEEDFGGMDGLFG